MSRLTFKRFIVFFLILISVCTSLFVFLASLGMPLPFLLFVISFSISLAIDLMGESIGKKLGTKLAKAKPKELSREDDVLLQAVPFSSAILFFFVNVAMHDESLKVFLSVLIAILTIPFYILRAWAKIKDSPKYRYYSMHLFAILLGMMVCIFLMISMTLVVSREFFGIFLLSTTPFQFSIEWFFLRLFRKALRERYGYKSEES